MDSERRLKTELAEIQRRGSGARYPTRVRRDVLKYVREKRAEGWSAGQISRAIGVNPTTWERWRLAEGVTEDLARENEEESKLSLVPIVVTETTPDGGMIEIVFEMPDGARVRGRGNQKLWLDTLRALRGAS